MANDEELADDLFANLGLNVNKKDDMVPPVIVGDSKDDSEEGDLMANLGLMGTSSTVDTSDVKDNHSEEEEWLDVNVPKERAAKEDAIKEEAPKEEKKSLKDEVQVINELMPITPEQVVVEEDNDDETPKRKNPVLQVVDDIGKNVGGVVDGIGKNVGGVVLKAKGAVDEHVAPKVAKLGQETSKHLGNIGKSTRSVMDQHVVAPVSAATKRTSESFTKLGQSTSQKLSEFGSHTSRTLQHVGASTKGALDQHVTPHVQKVQHETSQRLQQVSQSTRGAYQHHVAPRVTAVAKSTSGTYQSVTGWMGRKSPYYLGTAPGVWNARYEASSIPPGIFYFLEGTFRSFGRVVFCNNPVTGLIIFMALVLSSPLAGLCALVCSGTINIFAIGLRMDTELMRKGYLSYNGVLVGSGIATLIIFRNDSWLYAKLLSVVAAPMTLLAQMYTESLGINPLLFPHVGVMLFLLLSAKLLWMEHIVEDPFVDQDAKLNLWDALFCGPSQIFLSSSALSGILILLGVTLCSRITSLTLLLGGFLGSIVGGLLVGFDGAGIMGFNAALTLAALHFFIVPSKASLVLGAFGVVMVLVAQTAIMELFSFLSLPFLTLPYCLATLPILSLDMEKWFGESVASMIRLIPYKETTTPEEHLQRYAVPTKEDEFYEDIADGKDIVDGKGTEEEKQEHDVEAVLSEETTSSEETPLLAKQQ